MTIRRSLRPADLDKASPCAAVLDERIAKPSGTAIALPIRITDISARPQFLRTTGLRHYRQRRLRQELDQPNFHSQRSARRGIVKFRKTRSTDHQDIGPGSD